MRQQIQAAVMTGSGVTELKRLSLPDIGLDDGLLKIEAAGVCGSDVRHYRAAIEEPRILGHENLGRVVALGPIAKERWGVSEGDRVLLEEYLPCGHCYACRTGNFRSCRATDSLLSPTAIRFGSTPLNVGSGLWGGYAEYLYLHPRTVFHHVDEQIPATEAVLALPISNGIEWVTREGQLKSGQTVLILGPGQQGLGCVLAAKLAGARLIIVVGLSRDTKRLEVAKNLGADIVFHGANEDLITLVRDMTHGEGVDMVVDTARGSDETIGIAMAVLKKHGQLILPTGVAEGITHFPVAQLSKRCLTMRGVRGHSYAAVELAIEIIKSRKYPISEMSTHHFGLDQVDRAIRLTAGEYPEQAVHVTILPKITQFSEAQRGDA
ncbi:putative alcohol dehydrogenase adh [Alicyclobacillus acidoterrestris]|uniref:zinc-dependent alcohol dehydrogenase n=1 Tax=Alicyclobacillus suci TaxID=2816080 RepID=UPI00118F5263|nr:zinc-binding dehydrogenase [Alicyclobacillus suci]GEO27668.1 putative alcohol dehydrogenase adh [Alicyclobacillus acidoterrestris]